MFLIRRDQRRDGLHADNLTAIPSTAEKHFLIS